MAKWADYVITAVGFNASNTHIVEVEIRPDDGNAIGPARRAPRLDVVRAIRAGTTFVTAFERGGKWQRGEDVRVIQIDQEYFIRTDANAIRADNLGALPRLPMGAGAWGGR